ncbi:MAG: ankyrin repeat domain-containing protein [Spirochaetes bacterium]|nr:ankyrin repeat domain-containing protein [Spirochaetota bacterium]
MTKYLIIFIFYIMITGCNKKSDIFTAIEQNDLKSVKRIIKENKNVLLNQDVNYDYPIFYAIQLKSGEIVKYLMKFEINHTLTSLDDIYILNYADTFANFEIVKILIESGLDIDTLDTEKKTLLMAAPYGNRKELADYLIKKGANVNYQDPVHGQTALILCGFYGSYDVAMLLLENGADKKLQNKEGYTAEGFAVKFDHENVAELIRNFR